MSPSKPLASPTFLRKKLTNFMHSLESTQHTNESSIGKTLMFKSNRRLMEIQQTITAKATEALLAAGWRPCAHLVLPSSSNDAATAETVSSSAIRVYSRGDDEGLVFFNDDASAKGCVVNEHTITSIAASIFSTCCARNMDKKRADVIANARHVVLANAWSESLVGNMELHYAGRLVLADMGDLFAESHTTKVIKYLLKGSSKKSKKGKKRKATSESVGSAEEYQRPVPRTPVRKKTGRKRSNTVHDFHDTFAHVDTPLPSASH